MLIFKHKNASNSISNNLIYKCLLTMKILKFLILLFIMSILFELENKQIYYKKLFNFISSKYHFFKNKYINKFHKYYNYNISTIEKEKFFFMRNNSELKSCKNFGILIYNYPFFDPKIEFGNIGDYIQSLAALQYLPKNCIPLFVDRDNVEFYNNSKFNIIIIMNGWNRIEKGNRKTSNKINPIYISYHINNINFSDSITINNLKKYEPIGCRDIYTQQILEKSGINAYFSSCLTTTLDIDFGVNHSERTNEIIFIDYKFGRFPQADKYIKSLKQYNFSNIIYNTHIFKLNYSHLQRFRLAKQLLEQYARAKLVISTRIHGALPCLALNTSIIFVNMEYDRRYPGLYELLNTIGINSKGKFEINVQLDKNNLVINPKKYLKYANRLKETLQNLKYNNI